jgi:hypothetical protein
MRMFVPVTLSHLHAAFLTIEFCADTTTPSFGRDHPRPVDPGWAMADVLRMPALEIGHPIISFILVEAYDPSFHIQRFLLTIERQCGARPPARVAVCSRYVLWCPTGQRKCDELPQETGSLTSRFSA